MKDNIDVTNPQSPLRLVLREGGGGGGAPTASGLEKFGFIPKSSASARKRKQVGGALAAGEENDTNDNNKHGNSQKIRERLMLNPRVGLHPTKKGPPKEHCIRYLFAPYRAVQHGKKIAKVLGRAQMSLWFLLLCTLFRR